MSSSITFKTNKGTFSAELYPGEAPLAVENFTKLAKDGFYDGIVFHRVIPEFVVQGGDPLTKELPLTSPRIGSGGPGYTIKCETKGNPHRHEVGALSMAHAGKDTGGSQFFIVLNEQNTRHLNGVHTVFGKVTEGIDVVKQLQKGDTIEKLTVADAVPKLTLMHAEPQLAAFAIDLTTLHRRTVTSFYSNLVTRPTGRAVRMGVEQQLVAVGKGAPCVSVLDFTQVRVLDYSCADEIVAKLLLRYCLADRPVDAYFIARGLQDHHLESVEAVLERHGLLLAAELRPGDWQLLGPADPQERSCWSILADRRQTRLGDVVHATGVSHGRAADILRRFLANRVAVELANGAIAPVPQLHDA